MPVVGEEAHDRAHLALANRRENRLEPVEDRLGVLCHLRLENAPADKDTHQRAAGLGQ